MPFDGTDYQELPAVTKMLMDGRRRVQDGWCQGGMRQYGAVCMLGALMIASDYHGFTLAEQLLLGAIKELGYPHTSIVAFNDDLRRTKEEVLDVYDLALGLSA